MLLACDGGKDHREGVSSALIAQCTAESFLTHNFRPSRVATRYLRHSDLLTYLLGLLCYTRFLPLKLLLLGCYCRITLHYTCNV